MKTKTLLKQCRMKIAKSENYCGRGGKKLLANDLDVNYRMLIYALSGARSTKACIEILKTLNEVL